jgi:hypothetical protein
MNDTELFWLRVYSADDWICECGQRSNPASSDWRFNGEAWEHYHGYPIGHVIAKREPRTPKRPCRIKMTQTVK